MTNYQHNWYNLFPKSDPTKFIDFIDLAVPFLVYAQNRKRVVFADDFITVYWQIGFESPELTELLNGLYSTFTCDCSNCLYEKLGDDPEQGAYKVIRAFVTELAQLLKLEEYNQRIMQSTSVCEEFKEDFRTIVADLLKDTHTLQQAEKSLLYWIGLVPDALMQDGLVYMRYLYLVHLLKK